jgi:hypothetical protein
MTGYPQSNFRLGQPAADTLAERLQNVGFTVVRLPCAISIEFEDGCDAWLVAQDKQGCASVEKAWEEFQRINAVRRQALIGLRHHAVAQKVALDRSPDGEWATQLPVGTSSVNVGPPLTRLAVKHDAAEALHAFSKNQWGLKITKKLAGKFVRFDAPPAVEQPWRSEDESGTLFGPGLAMIDCTALQDDDTLKLPPDEVARKVLPYRDTPGQKLLEQLNVRIGRNRLGFDILHPGTADFRFSDGMDDLRVVPQGEQVARLIAEAGVEAAVERLFSEFEHLDRERGVALKLVKHLATRAGLTTMSLD